MSGKTTLRLLLVLVFLLTNTLSAFAATGTTVHPVPAVKPPLTVKPALLAFTSPKGGESFYQGELVTITWQGTCPSPHVSVWLLKQGKKVRNLAPYLPNTAHSAQMYISDTFVSGNDYQVLLEGYENKDFKLLSEKFSVYRNAIQVISPKGGDVWYKGNSYKITWNYTGKFSASSQVQIYLHDNEAIGWFNTMGGTLIAETSLGTGGSGSYLWKIPTSLVRKTIYRISVVLPGVPIEASKYFTINDIVK